MKGLFSIPVLAVLLVAGVASLPAQAGAQSYYYPNTSTSYPYGYGNNAYSYSYPSYSSYYPYNNSYGYGSSAYPYNYSYPYSYSYPQYSYSTYPSNYYDSYQYYGYPDPEIEDVDGPRTLEVGELGVWEVEIDAPRGSFVTISVDWDDDDRPYGYGAYGYAYSSNSNIQQSVQVPASQTVQFSHAYRKDGKREIKFRVRGGRKSDLETVDVRVKKLERLELDSLRPDSGKTGRTITIEGSGFTSSNDVHFGFGGERSLGSRDDGTEIKFEIPEWISQCDLNQYGQQYGQYGYYCGAGAQPVVPGVYPIYVTNSKGTSNTLYFEVKD